MLANVHGHPCDHQETRTQSRDCGTRQSQFWEWSPACNQRVVQQDVQQIGHEAHTHACLGIAQTFRKLLESKECHHGNNGESHDV